MGYDLELESIVFLNSSNPKNCMTFPIKGFVPYIEGQIIEKPGLSVPSRNEFYKVDKVKDIFLPNSEFVLCRRMIYLREIND